MLLNLKFNRQIKRQIIFIIGGIISLSLIFYLIFPYRYNFHDILSYSTRPLWDKEEIPTNFITHLHSEGISTTDIAACSRHNWKKRNENVLIYDATLFNSELEIFELRLKELWNVIDLFIIMESTHTMSGIKKSNLILKNNFKNFKEFESKLFYVEFDGKNLNNFNGQYSIANQQRNFMTKIINKLEPLNETLLVLMSDIDEIPSKQTLELVKSCETPLPLHFQLQNYIYSFEFPILANSWRSQIHNWKFSKLKFGYNHGKSSNFILTFSGWHCSFCFKTLIEFQQKMLSISEIDRLIKRPNFKNLLNKNLIQSKICNGKDLYNMLPEVYHWNDLIKFYKGIEKQNGLINLPIGLLNDLNKFNFLLPGNCKRQDGIQDLNIIPENLKI